MKIYKYIRPLLMRGDAEKQHERAIALSARVGNQSLLVGTLRKHYNVSDSRLRSEVAGITFSNPVGLAAGYDKNGRGIKGFAALGFGFVEIGSISAYPSDGNPKPRLWRFPREQAIIVNYGLPNAGAEVIAAELTDRPRTVPLGINLVKTNRHCNDPDDVVYDDYVRSATILQSHCEYLVLNLSCPNTENGRNFFADAHTIAHLLQLLDEKELAVPLFLKVSPLGGIEAIEALLEAVDPFQGVSGFIFNLPPGKPDGLVMTDAEKGVMPGAVAGKPIEAIINDAIRELYRRMDRDRYRIIGAGGVFNAEDAYTKIRLGASLVQLLTGLVYEGPGVVRRINQGLLALLERDGFKHIQEAVGADNQ